jgi:hypothetical protein
VTGWQRRGAREILLLFVVLSAVAAILSVVSHPVVPRAVTPIPFLATAFLAWRVSCGGWLSRLILLLVTGLQYAAALLAVATYWNLLVAALVVIYLVQLTLLFSPPVIERAGGRRGILAMARRPPGWLLAWGTLLGVLVTLAYLSRTGMDPILGCSSPPGSVLCSVAGQGYPLRWLTPGPGASHVHVGPLLKDCVQWILVSCSVVYAAWLLLFPARREQLAA